ncbi:hypothetical protein [Bradyrhizobium sp. AZCC 2289]|uniref:hypothetical protein n=1 Tax=Bradyrhizobium sp. AZCC 2289 TaxID=3117026 RepID=UPI002FF1AFA3
MNADLAGIRIPDSKLAREIMELVRDTEITAAVQDQYSLHDSWRLIMREDRQCESDFYRGVGHEEVPLCSRERRMREAEVGSQSAGAINF